MIPNLNSKSSFFVKNNVFTSQLSVSCFFTNRARILTNGFCHPNLTSKSSFFAKRTKGEKGANWRSKNKKRVEVPVRAEKSDQRTDRGTTQRIKGPIEGQRNGSKDRSKDKTWIEGPIKGHNKGLKDRSKNQKRS